MAARTASFTWGRARSAPRGCEHRDQGCQRRKRRRHQCDVACATVVPSAAAKAHDARSRSSGTAWRARCPVFWSIFLFFLTRFLSAVAVLNPFNLNPVRHTLAALIDFERLRTHCDLPIFVSATNVTGGTCTGILFRTGEISVDVLLASACLPSMHRTVEIDGEAYWDGGLSANPPVRPLLYECDTADIVLVLLHPDRRPKVPVSADDIAARWTELSFSAALFSERIDGISLAKQEAERSTGWLGGRLERRLRRLNLHRTAHPKRSTG